MGAGQHKLSRRALLAGGCVGAVLPLPRHAGLDPASHFLPAVEKDRGIPDQVRDDEVWQKALARFGKGRVDCS
jgi:hypothetical protein